MTSSTSENPPGGKPGKPAYVPDPGDIVWIDLDPQAGHEQAGHRPALVVSERDYNEVTGFAFLAPVTGTERGWPFEVKLSGEIVTTGVVLADQTKALDLRARGVRFREKAPAEVLSEVRERIRPILGL